MSISGQAREAVATARCAARYPLGLLERSMSTGRPRGDRRHDTPVLLVHGYGHNRSGWFQLERALRTAGFTSVHTLNYVAFGREGVEALGQRLAAKVDAVLALTASDKVHLVGHSLGGVLIRWYVQELGGDRYVDTAITVASPHEGTTTALLGLGPCARDLRPGSHVMRRLAAGARRTGVTWVAFHSDIDLVVRPAASATLRAPVLDAENVLVEDHGHIGIVTSPVVVGAVVRRLEDAAAPLAAVLPMHAASRPPRTRRPNDPRAARRSPRPTSQRVEPRAG